MARKCVDSIIEENHDRILDFIKDSERQYASRGEYNQYENMRVLFNLNTGELYTQVSGQGISKDVVDGIEQETIIEVHRFRSGDLADAAAEGVVDGMTEEEYIEVYLNSVL